MDVYIGARALLIAGKDGARKLSKAVPNFEAAVDALEAWLTARTDRPRVRLWIGGGLMRPFLLPSLAEVRSVQELQRIASALAPQRTGLGELCEVRIDGDLAVALPSTVSLRLAGIRIRGKPVRITSIRPWWTESLRAALGRDSAATLVAVRDCDAMTVLGGAEGRFTIATTLSPLSTDSAVAAAMKRLMLSHDVPGGAELLVRLNVTTAEDEHEAPLDCMFGSFAELER